MSSTQRQMVTGRDLVEEVKKRIIILSICVVGLSYLMSLTSTTVWMNLPAAAFLIILLRYFALDFEMRRKAAAYNSRLTTGNNPIQDKPLEIPKTAVKKGSWKRKVKSPPVEDAIDQFTRHLVSEWVTDLWYSKLTPDRDGPEELVQIINGVLGEISHRMRHINLVDLLARDMIHLICKHLELFRACQVKIEKKNLGLLSFEQRDLQLKVILAAENKLHPLMFSAESEHKVLQHVMDGVVSLTFNPEDLSCSFFRYVARELLACAVCRPVVNLVNPRFINERVEQVAMSVRNASKGTPKNDGPSSKQNGLSTGSSDDLSPFPDHSTTGVELVELKNTQSKSSGNKHVGVNVNGVNNSKDPLLAMDARSTRSWDDLPSGSLEASNNCIERSISGGEWGYMLDYFSRRKTQALAPEHFENMWSKGRDYNSKNSHAGEPVIQSSLIKRSGVVSSNDIQKHKGSVTKLTSTERVVHSGCNTRPLSETMYIHSDKNTSTPPPLTSDEDEEPQNFKALEETESGSNSYISSDDEDSRVTGLDSPTTKVWDGRTNRSSGVSHIHHPLEGLDGKSRRNTREQHQSLSRRRSGRKRSRLASQKVPMWQEVERTSFLSVDGQEIHPLRQQVKDNDSSDEYDMETLGRLQSGATASSSASSLPAVNSPQKAFLGDTFFTLRCEVVAANIVRSSSKTFAVYCISVIDADNNSWSIKRRYRHFEELHRRLKEYPEYSLHLPPKHFLSTGLDVPVIRERCKLLDEYLKKLMRLPRISGSIDVWDFLSIDSQTYTFSSAFSIVETLPVDLVYKSLDGSMNASGFIPPVKDYSKPRKDYVESVIRNSTSQANTSSAEGLNSDAKCSNLSPKKKPVQDLGKKEKEIEGGKKNIEPYVDGADDPTFPAEWVPPNLSGPILDLVDVVFQLQEGAWIRRKAFWVAKQVLQLGMGDALDDWLLEKIQRLHRGSVVASGIKRLEQILWPDGIFITKHPKRQKPPSSGNPSQTSSKQPSPQEDEFQKLMEQQEREAEERAKFVYELIIDNAPAAIVSLVGRKEYEQCARDLYFFLQSSVCLKQLVMDLLQLVLLHAFPELDQTFRQLREEKQKFGEFKPS